MYRMSVLRISGMAVLALALSLSLQGTALADHHEGMDPHAGHDHAMAEATDNSCPGCGMTGGLCAHCEPMAAQILGEMAVGMCPDCDDPGMLCEKCDAGVANALIAMQTLAPYEMDMDTHDMACLEGTLDGDFEALYGELFSLAGEQGLLSGDMMTGSVLPDAAADIDSSSAIYAAFSYPEGAKLEAPLFAFTIPAGEYMVFRHNGPDPGVTWMAAYTWLAMAEEPVRHAPAGEHHLGAPDADGNMSMDIFIPVGDDVAMNDMKDDAEEVDPHAGHDHSGHNH